MARDGDGERDGAAFQSVATNFKCKWRVCGAWEVLRDFCELVSCVFVFWEELN
jgi:hypothetical protein